MATLFISQTNNITIVFFSKLDKDKNVCCSVVRYKLLVIKLNCIQLHKECTTRYRSRADYCSNLNDRKLIHKSVQG